MDISHRRFSALLFILAVSLSVTLGLATSAQALTPITVQLKWLHQAQFAGFYAADQKGYYAAEGLSVSFVEGGPKIDPLKSVLKGTGQLGLAAEGLVLARAEGKPVRAIATIFRRSPVVYMALSDSGIKHPRDFIGKTIRVAVSHVPTLRAVMARFGITPNQYTEVTLPSDLTLLSSGKVDVWSVFVNAFVVKVKMAGYKTNLIFPDDYGVHFYGDTIFATDDFIAAKPKLVTRFLRATLKGWKYAVENPTAIGAMVTKYNPKADPKVENQMMLAGLPLVHTGEDHIGWMKPEVWAGMEKILREQKVLKAPLNVKEVYTLRFLKKIYGKGK